MPPATRTTPAGVRSWRRRQGPPRKGGGRSRLCIAEMAGAHRGRGARPGTPWGAPGLANTTTDFLRSPLPAPDVVPAVRVRHVRIVALLAELVGPEIGPVLRVVRAVEDPPVMVH